MTGTLVLLDAARKRGRAAAGLRRLEQRLRQSTGRLEARKRSADADLALRRREGGRASFIARRSRRWVQIETVACDTSTSSARGRIPTANTRPSSRSSSRSCSAASGRPSSATAINRAISRSSATWSTGNLLAADAAERLRPRVQRRHRPSGEPAGTARRRSIGCWTRRSSRSSPRRGPATSAKAWPTSRSPDSISATSRKSASKKACAARSIITSAWWRSVDDLFEDPIFSPPYLFAAAYRLATASQSITL